MSSANVCLYNLFIFNSSLSLSLILIGFFPVRFLREQQNYDIEEVFLSILVSNYIKTRTGKQNFCVLGNLCYYWSSMPLIHKECYKCVTWTRQENHHPLHSCTAICLECWFPAWFVDIGYAEGKKQAQDIWKWLLCVVLLVTLALKGIMVIWYYYLSKEYFLSVCHCAK